MTTVPTATHQRLGSLQIASARPGPAWPSGRRLAKPEACNLHRLQGVVLTRVPVPAPPH